MTITRYRLKKAWEVFFYWTTAEYVDKVSIGYRVWAGLKLARWYLTYPKGSFNEKN